MRRILAASLVVILMTAVIVPEASAGGGGVYVVAPLFGLAAFALAAPFIIAGQVIAATTVPYRAPAVAVAPPPAYSAPAHVESAAAYPAPTYTTYARPAPARGPAVSRVVEHPHGRYLLRGDGVNTAYQWVWLPNPPPPPPR